MNNKRICLECHEVIIGRTDKKFCSDQCRNTFNNKNKREEEQNILLVNKILRKNRSILKNLNPIGKSTVRREYLDLAGFNFNYCTRLYRTNSGGVYYMCYEFGYTHIADEKVLIINEQKYMNKKS